MESESPAIFALLERMAVMAALCSFFLGEASLPTSEGLRTLFKVVLPFLIPASMALRLFTLVRCLGPLVLRRLAMPAMLMSALSARPKRGRAGGKATGGGGGGGGPFPPGGRGDGAFPPGAGGGGPLPPPWGGGGVALPPGGGGGTPRREGGGGGATIEESLETSLLRLDATLSGFSGVEEADDVADDAGDEEADDVADEDEDEDEEDEDGEEEEEEDVSSSMLFTEGRNLSYTEGRDTEGKADSDALVSFSEPLPSSIVFRLTFAKLSVRTLSSFTLLRRSSSAISSLVSRIRSTSASRVLSCLLFLVLEALARAFMARSRAFRTGSSSSVSLASIILPAGAAMLSLPVNKRPNRPALLPSSC